MSKNKIGYGKQAEMAAGQIPQPFSYEYQGEIIEVNPLLSPADLANAVGVVTAIVVGADAYHPELMDFAVRFAVASTCITNVRWDYEHIFDRHYNQLMYTDLYGELTSALGEHDAAGIISDIRLYATEKVQYLVALQEKSTIDLMVENLLIKIGDYLDKMEQNLAGTDVNAVINAVNTMKELSDEDKLVPKILEFRAGQEENNDIGGGTTPISGE